MSRFDEEPDGDPHGECAAEIHRLQTELATANARAAEAEAKLAETQLYAGRAEGALAGLGDIINQEIRENGRWDDQANDIDTDLRPFVRRLVDYVRQKYEARAITAELDAGRLRETLEYIADNSSNESDREHAREALRRSAP